MKALRIRIPQRYQLGIAKLISLPDDAIEDLLSVFNEMPQSLHLDRIKEHIILTIPMIPEHDINEIIDAVNSLYQIKCESYISAQDFSEQVL